MNQQTRGLVIAGTQSGVGKTTVTLGLLYALRRRGLVVQPFKVGPDFIDPGHHSRAAGRVCRNLDGWMLSREANLALFRRQARGADVAVVEGVMGLFDGYDGASEAGSTAQMAKWLGLPVLLVVDARAMARSAAALVHGFASFDPDLSLAGVVFNRIGSATHLEYLQQALTSLPGVRCFGGLPRDQELAIPERHLGLATAEDHPLDEAYLGRPGRPAGDPPGPPGAAGSAAASDAAGGAGPGGHTAAGAPGGGPGPGLLLLLPGKFGVAGELWGGVGPLLAPGRPGAARRSGRHLPGRGVPRALCPSSWPPMPA